MSGSTREKCGSTKLHEKTIGKWYEKVFRKAVRNWSEEPFDVSTTPGLINVSFEGDYCGGNGLWFGE